MTEDTNYVSSEEPHSLAFCSGTNRLSAVDFLLNHKVRVVIADKVSPSFGRIQLDSVGFSSVQISCSVMSNSLQPHGQ